MGSDATRLTFKSHCVLVFLVPWVAAGVLVAIKTKTLVAAIAPAAVPAIVSTWLFFATETSTCELGDLGATDFIFLVSVDSRRFSPTGAVRSPRGGNAAPWWRSPYWWRHLLTILGHVQWSNCSGFSQQISRELEAVVMFGFFLAAAAAIASLGRLTAGIVRNRRSQQTLGAPIA